MRYVPNLIPEKSKVLPDYFKGELYKATKRNPLRDLLMWLLGIFCFLSALVYVIHPLLFLLFGFTGGILIPPGHRLLERKFRFRLTPKVKAIVCSTLFVSSLPLAGHYTDLDRQTAYQKRLQEEKTEKERAIAENKEQQRKDSLIYYIHQSSESSSRHKIEEASELLQYAVAFVRTSEDSNLIKKGKNNIASIKTLDLVKAGKYQAALPEINSLLTSDPSNAALVYNRAICYSKTGKIREAVSDLDRLIEAGNADAEKLRDKINPVRKRIVGYETLCCDGSTSSARGRGACSHHGGVCDWNHPIYEEYRKYE